MPIYAILSVGAGAALGAWLRWAFGTWLNPVFPSLPIGTLAANLMGGYMIGFAVVYFREKAGLPPEAQLFVITGFLGGLTTFSTFSAEAVNLLLRAQYFFAAVHIAAHLTGSLFMTVLGMFTLKWLKA